MAMGMWGPRALLREALIIQNQLALLIRELGLYSIEVSQDDLSWEDWIHIEGDSRTKFMAYCFFNLQYVITGYLTHVFSTLDALVLQNPPFCLMFCR
jgi:hypothetical protein